MPVRACVARFLIIYLVALLFPYLSLFPTLKLFFLYAVETNLSAHGKFSHSKRMIMQFFKLTKHIKTPWVEAPLGVQKFEGIKF